MHKISNGKSENNDTVHIAIFDALRGFAALSVCLYHFVCGNVGYVTSGWVLSLFNPGINGVPLFMFISGFVLPFSMYYGGYRLKAFFPFLYKRLIRLEPAYIFSLFIAIALFIIRQKYYATEDTAETISFWQVVFHLGYFIPFSNYKWINPVYWTLAIEFQYYILIAVIYPFIIRGGYIRRIILYIGVIAACYIGSSAFLPYWLPFFLFGITTFYFIVRKIEKKEFILVVSILSIFCIYRYSIAVTIYTLIGVLSVCFLKDKKIYFFSWLGKLSYSLYLIHPLTGAIFIHRLSFYYTEPWQKFLVNIGALAITILLSWLTYYFIEKPSLRLSKKIKFT